MGGIDGARMWKRAGAGAGARRGAIAIFGALLWVMTGCGSNVVMPAWLNLDPSQSTLQLAVDGQPPSGSVPLEGGIYAVIHLDLTDPLLIKGTIDVPQVRIGAFLPGLGPLCVATDPANPANGTLSINVLTGASQVNLPLNTITWSPALGTVSSQAAPSGLSFPLDPSLVTAVLNNGELDGVIQQNLTLDQTFQSNGLNVDATINAFVTSSSVPPQPPSNSFVAARCPAHWADQVGPLEIVVNSKGTYLRTIWDNPKAPRMVSLAQLGAVPGDTLRLSPQGSFLASSVGPTSSRMAAAFSATPTVSPNPSYFGNRNRLPDAIDAGLDVITPRTLYFGAPTDISQDFEVKPDTDVVVPQGAQYLFFTPIDSYFQDNVSTDLRVQVEVNPTP